MTRASALVAACVALAPLGVARAEPHCFCVYAARPGRWFCIEDPSLQPCDDTQTMDAPCRANEVCILSDSRIATCLDATDAYCTSACADPPDCTMPLLTSASAEVICSTVAGRRRCSIDSCSLLAAPEMACVPLDGGVDAGPEPLDAGVDSGARVPFDAGLGRAVPGTFGGAGGCTCRAAPSSPRASTALFALGFVAFLVRRRRS
ncbi:MAG: MYXO-CTERM sorting domain-containing protein [Sandaracinaceae bacterium]